MRNEGVTMLDRRGTDRVGRTGPRRETRGDLGSALLVVMAAAAILFVIAASVVGIVVFQTTQQNHAQAVTRSTALAQQGMEAYLTALRTDPDYWNTTPTIQGVGRDGTWTVAANVHVTPNTITAVGRDTSTGILHVIRAEVRLESFSDYTIVSGDPLTLGNGMGDINISGNVRSNSTITLKQKFTNLNAYYAVGGVIPPQNADVTARVAPVDFGRVEGLFPGLYTAARSRPAWGATNLTGDPTAGQLEKSLVFYRDPNNAARNYWGTDSNHLSQVGSGNETDLAGVGVDFSNGSDHSTGLFYIRSVWPANVTTGNKAAVSRQQFLDFAHKDPTWNIGVYGDIEAPGRSFGITPRGLNPNGNNVIYVGGDLDVYVKGEYARSVTIVSERDIYIIGDVTRASDAPTATLGLVAKRNIIICGNMPDSAGTAVYTLPNGETNGYSGKSYTRADANRLMHGETLMSPSSPTVLKIQAAMMAVNGAVVMDPDVTEPTTQPAKRNATLKIRGSIVAKQGLQGPNFANEYNATYGGFGRTEISFDPQLQETPPPLYPQIGAGALKVIRWDEYTTNTDPNEGLYFPPPGVPNDNGPTQDDGSSLIVVVPPGGDTIAPRTVDNAVPVYNGEAVISLAAADNPGGAGVWKTWYTVDNQLGPDGKPKVFQGDTVVLASLPPNTAATRTVDFWSMDQAGNTETTQSATFRMVGRDTMPPVTTVIDSLNPSKALPDGYPQIGDPDYVVYGDFKPKFTSVDTTDGLGPQMVWVIQDNDNSTAQGWDDPSPTMTIPYPPAGFVTRFLEYYGIDKAGNREQSRTLTIKQHAPDIMPPTTFFDAQPTYVGDAVIHLTGVDDVEGQGMRDTWYQIDGGDWKQSKSNPTTLTVVAPARGSAGVAHTLSFYSRDASPKMNQEPTQTVMFTVLPPLNNDVTPPFTTSDAKDSYVGPAVIRLSSYDEGGVDHIFWTLDGGPQQIGTRIDVADPLSGTASHTITYGAVDKAGNVEIAKSQSFTITPERIAPITAAHNNDLYNGPAVFQLTAEDNAGGSGLKSTWFKIDDGPYQAGTTLMGLTWVTVTGDGLHTISYYSVDNADNAEEPKTTTLRIDTTPPVTTTDNTGSYAGQAVVHLTATDVDGSGVREIHWRNQADGFEQVSNPIMLGAGSWTVDYWAVDKAGNVEDFKTFQCTVTALPDNAAPTSYDDVVPYYNRSVSPAIIHLYSWDVQSGVKTMHYKVDGVESTLTGKGNPPDSYAITVSGDATHTLEYWAEDNAGNVESTHTTKTFKVDTILPVTSITARAGGTYWSTQTFVLSSIDAGSGIKGIYYSLDGAPTVKGTQVYVAAPTDGYSHAHVIQYWAADYAGNVEYPAKVVSFVSKPSDTDAPTTYARTVSTTADSISLYLSAFDNLGGSGVEHTYFRIDSGPQTDGHIVTINGTGAHTLEYWSTDYAGNIEVHKSMTFNVDGVPPTTVSDVRSVYNAPAVIKLTATDNANGSGVAATLYRIDGGSVTTGTAPITSFSVSGSGQHTLEFWSSDLAGNVEAPHKMASFKIDMVAPTTTSDIVGTYAGPAVINLSAIDDTGGSGVAYTYYKLDTGARMTGTSLTVPAPTAGAVWHTLYFWSVDNAGNTEAQTSATFQVAAVANMTFSLMTPAEFSTVGVRNPDVSVKAVADQVILSASATIDGISRPVTLTNPGGYMVTQGYWDGGYYTDDGCGGTVWVAPFWVDTSYWVPADPNSAIATYSTSGLANGTHVASVTFMNASGASKTKSWTFTVNAPADVTAPVTTSNAVAMYSAATTITLTASDEVGGMGLANTFYKLDGTQQTGTVPTTSVGVATQGQHTLLFWSTDKAGNKETTKTASFMVDWTAPTTASNVLSSYAGTATVTLTPADNTGGSGLKYTYYQVDAGAQTAGTSIVIAPPLVGAPVQHTIKFWSVDNAGNTEVVKTATFSVSIPPDTIAPTTTSNAVASYLRPSTIALTAVDNPGGWGVANTFSKLDGGAQLTGNNPSTGGAGAHTLEFWSVDAAANIETPHKFVSYTVAADTTPPTTTSNAVPFYTGQATITLTATDTANGWGVAYTYFKVDAGVQQTGNTIVVAPPLGTPVDHTITFWSVDLAGNVESPAKTATFSVEGAPVPMTFSAMSPAPGAMLGVSNPTVSITALALAPITSVTAKVDGVAYTPTVTPGGGYTVVQGYWDGGYYTDDGCGGTVWVAPFWVDTSYWVASNPNQATATFPTSGLASGSHTVSVTFILGTTERTTKTWTFTTDVAAPTTTASVLPSYTGTATISLVATDNFGGSGVQTTYYKLDSGVTATGTTVIVPNPFTGPLNHTLYYWSVDAVGNVEAQKSASFVSNPLPDTIAPTTTSNALAAYASPANITLTAVDNVGGWGVARIFYSLDNAAYQSVESSTASVPTGGGGVHTLRFYAQDRAGNTESPVKSASYTVSVDITAPTTTSNAVASYTGPATITLTATDNSGGWGVANTYYKLDGGAQTAGTVIVVPDPLTGSVAHHLEFWSVDRANNEETPHKTADFTVIATPATVTWSNVYPSTTYIKVNNPTITVTGQASLAISSVVATIDGVAVTPTVVYTVSNTNGAVSMPRTGMAGGSHTVTVTFTVTGGRQATKTWTFTVDTIAPTTTSSIVPTYTGAAGITFSATDNTGGSGVANTYYKLDSAAYVAGTSLAVPAPVGGSAAHTISFYSTDNAGNVETTQTKTFTINALADTTPPTTGWNGNPYYGSTTATFSITATDTGWGVQYIFYRLDDGPVTTGTVPFTIIGTGAEGQHKLEFWAVDFAGNVSAHQFVYWIVDLTAPVTSSDATATYTSSANINLTVTDKAPSSGIAYTRYRIDSGAQMTGTSISVAGPLSGAPVLHTVYYWSGDNAGNVEVTNSRTFTIAPALANVVFTNQTPTPNSTIVVRNPTVSVMGQATANIAGVTATLNGITYPVTVTYPNTYLVSQGYWAGDYYQDDGCGNTVYVPPYWVDTSYWVTDNTKALATFATSGLPDGTYTVVFSFAVTGQGQALSSWTFNVGGPDGTPPTTTSNLQPAYIGTATITLTATDNPGGSGVKSTYYKLDSGAQTTGTVVTVAPPAYGAAVAHTIEFWSVDNLNNVETPHKTGSFTVAPMPDSIAPTTVSNALATYTGTANITLTATDNLGGWGVASTNYRIDGGTQVSGTAISVPAPTAFSAVHTISFWSVDRAGNTEVAKTATITVNALPDTTAPTTGHNALSVYPAPSTITLSPVDNTGGWGIANTFWKLDTGAVTTGTTVATGGEGSHTLLYWSVDKAGNSEATKTVTYKVDMTAPTTTSNALAAYAGSASITLSPVDNVGGSGIKYTYYTIDAGAQLSGITITVAGPATGLPVSHTITFWSVDVAGNTEVAKSATFTVSPPADTTPPTTTSNAVAFYAGPSTITLTAVDNTGGWGVDKTYYSVDGAAAGVGTAVPTGGSGVHTLQFWSTDLAGNKEATKTASYNVDMTAPTTTSNALSSYTGTATITLTAADNVPGSGLKYTYYKVDGGTQVVGTTILVAPPVYASAVHHIDFYSVDNMNNTETAKGATFTVSAQPDSIAPTTVSNASATYSAPATITLTATDNSGGWGVSAVYYNLDGAGATSVSASTCQVGTGGGGSHTLEFWSVDRANNTETPHKSVTYYVTPDTTPPITTSNATGYYIGSATITLSASDTGWGVAGTYYKVDGGAQQTGTAISIAAPIAGSVVHTIAFWSVDKAGNVETANNATFTVDSIPAVVAFSNLTPVAGSSVGTGTTVVSVKAVADKNITNVTATLDGVTKTPTNSITSTTAVSTFTATGLTNGTHTVVFTVTNSVGAQASKTWTFNVSIQSDFTPPTTLSDAVNQYFGDAVVTLFPSDNPGGTGVKATYFTLDGGAQTTGTSISVAAPLAGGPVTHTITFWSVDNAGNIEIANSKSFTVAIKDVIAPTTTSNALSAYVAASTIQLTASDNDGGSGVAHTYYRLDGGTTTEGTLLGTGGVGTHMLEFWSVDNAGNIESPHKNLTYKVDSTAPVTTSNAQLSYTGPANITLTPTDEAGGSGVKYTYYKVDTGGQTSGTSISVAPPTFSSVQHTIYFWSIDNAGNIETTKSATFTIAAPADTTAPSTISDYKSVYAVPGLITLTATDNYGGWGVATTYYRLDGATVATGTAIRTGGPGAHTLEFWSIDRADNTETPHKSISYSVTANDTTKPVTTSNALSAYTGQARISLTATDNCGVPPTTFFRIDSGAETTGSLIVVAPPRGGTVSHTIYFWSVDINGNVEVANTKTFTITAVPANMVFTGMTPGDGQTVNVRNPGITVTAQDTQAITDAVIVIDNVAQTTSVILNNTLASAAVSAYGLADGQHTVAATFTDALGASSTKTWNFTVAAPADVTAPVTTSNGVSAYAGTAVISLSASDEAGGLGVAYTYYKLDGGVQLTGTAPNTTVSVAAAGSHTIEFWSVDLANNQEWPHKTVTFNVDLTPPTTLSNAQTAYNTPTAEITLSPTDNTGGSGVRVTYYKVDTGLIQTGTQVSVPAPASGSGVWHTIYFWSVDNAGNVESQRSATFKSWPVPDTIAPTTTSNASSTYAVPGVIQLTATDNAGGWGVASTYYRLDGGVATVGLQVPTGGPGAHSLEFWSVDGAGNEETPHKTVSYTVAGNDTIAPTTSSDASATYPLGTGQIRLTATDNVGGSGVAHTYYTWDDGPQVESTLIGVTGAGTHHIDYWSVDWAGNIEAPKTATFVVTAPDLTAPTTVSNALASYTGTATVVLTPTDNAGGAGVRATWYKVDGGTVQSGLTIVIAPPATGIVSHTIVFWSVDNAGNAEVEKQVTFTVAPLPDTIAPTTTSNGVASYTGQATIALSATDNVNGSGVNVTYYRVDDGVEQAGTSVVVAAPASGTVSHHIDFWSVDKAGNIEAPHAWSFTVTAAATGTATLSFRWPGYGLADLSVHNAAGAVIASTRVQGSGSGLSWDVTVPAGQNYYMSCDYYEDWDSDGYGGPYGVWTGVMPTNGTYYWSY